MKSKRIAIIDHDECVPRVISLRIADCRASIFPGLLRALERELLKLLDQATNYHPKEKVATHLGSCSDLNPSLFLFYTVKKSGLVWFFL